MTRATGPRSILFPALRGVWAYRSCESATRKSRILSAVIVPPAPARARRILNTTPVVNSSPDPRSPIASCVPALLGCPPS